MVTGIEGVSGAAARGARTHLLRALLYPIRARIVHIRTSRKKRSRHVSLTAPAMWIIAHAAALRWYGAAPWSTLAPLS